MVSNVNNLKFYKTNSTSYEDSSFLTNSMRLGGSAHYVQKFNDEMRTILTKEAIAGTYGFEDLSDWTETDAIIKDLEVYFNLAATYDIGAINGTFTIAVKMIGDADVKVFNGVTELQSQSISNNDYNTVYFDLNGNYSDLKVEFTSVTDVCVKAIIAADTTLEYTMCGFTLVSNIYDITPYGAAYEVAILEGYYTKFDHSSIAPLGDGVIRVRKNGFNYDTLYGSPLTIQKVIDALTANTLGVYVVGEMIVVYDEYEIEYVRILPDVGANITINPIGTQSNLEQCCTIEVGDYTSEPFKITSDKLDVITYSDSQYRQGLIADFEYKVYEDVDIRRISGDFVNSFEGQRKNYTLKGYLKNVRELKTKRPIPDYLCDILAGAFNCENTEINGEIYAKEDEPSYEYLAQTAILASFEAEIRLSN